MYILFYIYYIHILSVALIAIMFSVLAVSFNFLTYLVECSSFTSLNVLRN